MSREHEATVGSYSRLSGLVRHWRAEAASLRGWGACAEATVLERAADELEHATREDMNEALTLEDAARRTGYSAEHLGRLVRQGKLENVGRKHAPRVRRGDLRPKLDLPDAPAAATVDSTRTSIVRAIANSSEG